MSNVDFTAMLGSWPQTYDRQLEFFQRMKTLLQRVNTFVLDNTGNSVVIEQASEPVQLDWETAWTTQTGLSLPIPASAQLFWWDTATDRLGGVYGTVEGNPTVYRREHQYPHGSTIVTKTDYKTNAVTLTYAIGTNFSDHPSVSFSLPVAADIIMEYSLFVQLNSGSGQWGADFYINGIKAGTQYLGIATNQGIVNAMTSGILRAHFVLSDAPPGNYTIQSAFGVTASPASPPTLKIGGILGIPDQFGVRSLIVRGVVK